MTAASARSGPASRRVWSTVADIRAALRRRWDRGELLSALVGGEGWEPIRVPLRAPTSREMATDFGAVQDWATQLHRDAGPERRAAFRLETRTVGGRHLGANAVPLAVRVDEPEQAWPQQNLTKEEAAFTMA
jgi:hypothetical protein